MFELTKLEFDNLRSQIVTSSWGGTRYSPMAFTEQGVAMLSSVLNSDRAIKVNIQIMRAFTQLRQMLLTHKDLKNKIEAMEKKYDQQFQIIFEAIKQLLEAILIFVQKSTYEIFKSKAPGKIKYAYWPGVSMMRKGSGGKDLKRIISKYMGNF